MHKIQRDQTDRYDDQNVRWHHDQLRNQLRDPRLLCHVREHNHWKYYLEYYSTSFLQRFNVKSKRFIPNLNITCALEHTQDDVNVLLHVHIHHKHDYVWTRAWQYLHEQHPRHYRYEEPNKQLLLHLYQFSNDWEYYSCKAQNTILLIKSTSCP